MPIMQSTFEGDARNFKFSSLGRLIFCDAPYDIDLADPEPYIHSWYNNVRRYLERYGVFVVSATPHLLKAYLNVIDIPLCEQIVWYHNWSSSYSYYRWSLTHLNFLVFTEGQKGLVANKEIRETSDHGTRIPGTVWPIHRNKWPRERGLPLQVVERFILGYTYPGDMVIDPFCGYGTVPLACRIHGRSYIAIDNDPEMVNYTRYRLSREYQGALSCSSNYARIRGEAYRKSGSTVKTSSTSKSTQEEPE